MSFGADQVPARLLAVALGASVTGAVLYWLLIITEGTYLGPRVVVLLYDWAAKQYDSIKDLHFVNESRFIGLPLGAELGTESRPWLLDVATGTGRVPMALLNSGDFDGIIAGVDRSQRMLARAQEVTSDCGGCLHLICGDAQALPFREGSFHGASCLESLEFMGNADQVVAEMLRVLKPGGILLLSNRVGNEAWLFPGRLAGRGRLETHLNCLGLAGIRTQRWQAHYDLVWARKPESRQTAQCVFVAGRFTSSGG